MAFTKSLIVGVAILFTSNAMAIPLGNEGFELGDFSGYTLSGDGAVTTTISAAYGNIYSATEGNYFASLYGYGADTSAYGGTTGSILTTNLSLSSGDQFSFDWAFLAFDISPYLDFSLFVGDKEYSLADIGLVGNYGESGWTTFSWTADSMFSGNIYFVVSNSRDEYIPSKLLIDNLRVVEAPEPSILGLLFIGIALMIFLSINNNRGMLRS